MFAQLSTGERRLPPRPLESVNSNETDNAHRLLLLPSIEVAEINSATAATECVVARKYK